MKLNYKIVVGIPLWAPFFNFLRKLESSRDPNDLECKSGGLPFVGMCNLMRCICAVSFFFLCRQCDQKAKRNCTGKKNNNKIEKEGRYCMVDRRCTFDNGCASNHRGRLEKIINRYRTRSRQEKKLFFSFFRKMILFYKRERPK